jgi:Domain of unknown function (DUF397)
MAELTQFGRWRKSSYSANEANCVECAVQGGTTGVRDSKAPTGGLLVLRRNEWAAFLTAVKHEQFGG